MVGPRYKTSLHWVGRLSRVALFALAATSISACGDDEANPPIETPDPGDNGGGDNGGGDNGGGDNGGGDNGGGDNGGGDNGGGDNDCTAGLYDHDDNPETDCIAWKSCIAGTYIAVEGTPSSDRICDTCGDGTFTGTENQSTCAPWTLCEDGESLAAAGTSSSDAVCEQCAAGTWDHDGEADTVCIARTTCAAGTYAIASGSDISDRVCEPCQDGTFSSAENVSQCTPWTLCESGTQQTQAGSAIASPTCQQCPEGSWDDDNNPLTACVSWTTCEAGTFVSTQGSPTSNQVCSPCAEGTFTSQSNWGYCEVWETCQAGEFQVTPGSATSNPTCIFCPEGTYDHDGNALTACVDKSMCSPGTSVFYAGSLTEDRTCAACNPNGFSTTTNASACTLKQVCTPGNFVTSEGSPTENRTCAACESGSFTDAHNEASCRAWNECSPGTFQLAAGTAQSDFRCQTCANSWDDDGNPLTACAPWATCDPGTFVSSTPSATTNRSCEACAAEHFSDSPNQLTCSAWSGPTCRSGEEFVEGTSSSDEACQPWTVQFSADESTATSAALTGSQIHTAVDSRGNLYVAINAVGAFYFADFLVNPSVESILGRGILLKFDSHGVWQWSRVFNVGDHSAGVKAIAIDSLDNVIVAGSSWGALTLPEMTDPHVGWFDVWVTKLSRDGEVQWSRLFGGPRNDSPDHLVVLEDNSIVVGGYSTDGYGPLVFEELGVFFQPISAEGILGTPYGIDSSKNDRLVSFDVSPSGFTVALTQTDIVQDVDPGAITLTSLDATHHELYAEEIGAALYNDPRLNHRGKVAFVDNYSFMLVASTYLDQPTEDLRVDCVVRRYDVSGWRTFNQTYSTVGLPGITTNWRCYDFEVLDLNTVAILGESYRRVEARTTFLSQPMSYIQLMNFHGQTLDVFYPFLDDRGVVAANLNADTWGNLYISGGTTLDLRTGATLPKSSAFARAFRRSEIFPNHPH